VLETASSPVGFARVAALGLATQVSGGAALTVREQEHAAQRDQDDDDDRDDDEHESSSLQLEEDVVVPREGEVESLPRKKHPMITRIDQNIRNTVKMQIANFRSLGLCDGSCLRTGR